MTKELVRADPGVPAELIDAGVKVVEAGGYRSVMFPPELREAFNILLPAQQVAQAVELVRPSIRAVQLDADFENGGHFYNQGTKSKPRLAPTKQALETLAFTAGIMISRTRPLSYDELRPYGEGAIGFEATVTIRRPDGTPLEISRSKFWQPDVEYRKVQAGNRPSWADSDQKWAAELHKRWLAEKEFAPAKAESKAILRAIRAALQIPHTFTPEQAAKPFIVVGYDLALDYSDPDVVRLLLERRADRTREVYGSRELPAESESAGEQEEKPSVESTASDPGRADDASSSDEGEEPGSDAKSPEPAPLFSGEEPPEPEVDPEPAADLSLVLPDELTRYGGQMISDVVAAGDVVYLKWLAGPNVHDERINEAARTALKGLGS